MGWTGLVLTEDGRHALSSAQASKKLKIKSIAVGDGAPEGEFQALRGLAHQLYEIRELEISAGDAACTITAELPEQAYEYYFREIGVMAETEDGVKLYAYDNCGEDAQKVMPGTGKAAVKRRVRLTLAVAGTAEVTVTNPAAMYVTYDDFQEALKGKADAEEDKGLSSNDYTDEDKTAVAGLAGLSFGKDADGNWGYKAPGAEETVPFGASGGGGAVELWRNRIPPPEFDRQTISLSDSINNYKYYEILFVSCFRTTIIYSSGRLLLPYSSVLECAAGLGANDRAKVIYSREFYFGQDGVSVTFEPGAVLDLKSGEADGGSTEAAIPVMILGYKQ